MHLLLARTPHLRRADGSSVTLAALDAALLAWLAVEGATGRDRLATLLWPQAEGDASRNNLRQRLFRLRRDHGEGLVAGRVTLSLGDGVSHDLGAAPSLLGDWPVEAAGEFAQWLAARPSSTRVLTYGEVVNAGSTGPPRIDDLLARPYEPLLTWAPVARVSAPRPADQNEYAFSVGGQGIGQLQVVIAFITSAVLGVIGFRLVTRRRRFI